MTAIRSVLPVQRDTSVPTAAKEWLGRTRLVVLPLPKATNQSNIARGHDLRAGMIAWVKVGEGLTGDNPDISPINVDGDGSGLCDNRQSEKYSGGEGLHLRVCQCREQRVLRDEFIQKLPALRGYLTLESSLWLRGMVYPPCTVRDLETRVNELRRVYCTADPLVERLADRHDGKVRC